MSSEKIHLNYDGFQIESPLAEGKFLVHQERDKFLNKTGAEQDISEKYNGVINELNLQKMKDPWVYSKNGYLVTKHKEDLGSYVGIGTQAPKQMNGIHLEYLPTEKAGFITANDSLFLFANAYHYHRPVVPPSYGRYSTAAKAACIVLDDTGTISFVNTDTVGTAGNLITWSERMRVTSTGIVSINNNSPTARRFEVKGDSTTAYDSGDNLVYVHRVANVADGGATILLKAAYSGSNDQARYAISGASDGTGDGERIGVWGWSGGSGTGVKYGGYFQVSSSAGESQAVYVSNTATGTSTKYGVKTYVNITNLAGTIYGHYIEAICAGATPAVFGLYSSVSGGTGSYSGYFTGANVHCTSSFVSDNTSPLICAGTVGTTSTAYAGWTGTGAGAHLRRYSSSLKYKKDIIDNSFNNIDNLLKLELKKFRFKKEKEEDPENGLEAGYIIEQVHQLGLTDMVAYNEKGEPDGFRIMGLSMHILEYLKKHFPRVENLERIISDLNQRIKKLEDLNGKGTVK